jgi:DNA-binding transcriptional regulator YbjK
MPRRYDPDRRRRLIDAAIRVVGRDGIAGLSHRSVAAEADVPLGSTTYHFATLEELMVAALRQSNENFGRVLAEQLPKDGEGDLAAELARALGAWLGGDRTGVELEYELYLEALRRPALRPVAAEWTEAGAARRAPPPGPGTPPPRRAPRAGLVIHVVLSGE